MNKIIVGPDFKKCQFFTKPSLAEELLEIANYQGELGKGFLEPACGDGQILLQAVQRYLLKNLRDGKSTTEIKHGLEKDFVGYELDPEKHKCCVRNLDDLASRFGLSNVSWQIYLGDALKDLSKKRCFQFIVGNPPYISFANLSSKNREFCRRHFLSCRKGKFDYSFAFIERCLDQLEPGGALCFVVPSAIFKVVSGETLREIIKQDLAYLEDGFSDDFFLFDGSPNVSATVFMCEKGSHVSTFLYRDRKKGPSIRLPKCNLKKKWVFSLPIKRGRKEVSFGDVYEVHSSVATLLNDAFLLKGHYSKKFFISDDGTVLEKDLVLPAASPSSCSKGTGLFIIFPYVFKERTLFRIPEEIFQTKYPRCYEYLSLRKKDLLKADRDRSSAWFEYGRSQNISHVNRPKLLVSILLTNKVKAYPLSDKTVPYSGIVVYQKSSLYDLERAKRLLESPAFMEYVKAIGIRSSGKSYRILPSDLKNFAFEEPEQV